MEFLSPEKIGKVNKDMLTKPNKVMVAFGHTSSTSGVLALCPCPPFHIHSSPLPSLSTNTTSFLWFLQQAMLFHTSVPLLTLFLLPGKPFQYIFIQHIAFALQDMAHRTSCWEASPKLPHIQIRGPSPVFFSIKHYSCYLFVCPFPPRL